VFSTLILIRGEAARLGRRVRARLALALAVAYAVTCGVASPALALEPGVYVDPGSPAGKEYSVPLSALRQSGSGHGGAADGTQPMFGIGISPPRVSPHAGHVQKHGEGSGQTTHDHPTGTGGSAPKTPARGAASPGSTGPVGAAAGSATLAGLTHHGSAAPAVALIAALVVFGGLALGTAVLATVRRLG
jgi:hypothetical protein